MTSIEWLFEQIKGEGDIQRDVLSNVLEIKISVSNFLEIKREAKLLHKQEIIDAYNKSFELRDKPYSTADKYYQETFVSKGSDECQFEPTTNTSSATICKHCGIEKYLHTT